MEVTPWDVNGKIDYDKLIQQFGVKRLTTPLKKLLGNHFMVKRDIFFAHRDLDWLFKEYEKGNKFFLYTGRSPSGNMHLGHLFPLMFTKYLQDKFDVELWIQFPDEEKFLFKKDMTFEKTQEFLQENMKDIAAIGFNPKKTHFLINTVHAGSLYKEACKVAKKITFNSVKSTFGFKGETNIGSIFYTSMQAVPAFLPSILKNKNIPCLIPHAIDQDPHFRLTRDVLPKLGFFKPASIQCSFLPPLSGIDGKMSSSKEEGAIYTTDDEKIVKKKINKYAFSGGGETIEEHRKNGGNPNLDISFQYLKMFFEPDDKKLANIEEDYHSGKLLSGELKTILIKKINIFLKDHQKKRESVNVNQYIWKGKQKT